MFKSYLKIALRNLTRRKAFSFINIAGLTVGMACCLLIFRFVAFERSFDRFHADGRDLYRVLLTTPQRGESSEMGGAYTGYALAPALAASVPEVLRVARIHPEYGGATISNPDRPDRVFEEENALYADPAFLRMFSFPLVAGNPAAALLRPGTALLSETTARKYFGTSDPVGLSLQVAGQIDRVYQVAGVFRDVPPNSHLRFDFLFPMDDLVTEGYAEEPEHGWSWNNFATYVQLRPGADRAAAERKMTSLYEERRRDVLRQQGRTVRVAAQRLQDIHLNAAVSGPTGVIGSSRTVYFFTLIGLVTLLIALINSINLATARALDRAREVGLRKTVGADRRQLVGQFLFETALLNTTAAAAAVGVAALLGPVVNSLAETGSGGGTWLHPGFWAAFAGTLAGATLVSGLYPALVLSSFRPAVVLKAKIGASGTSLRLRRALVVAQFAASVVLIGGTAVVDRQLDYVRRMDLGLNLERVLTVRGPRVLRSGTDRVATTKAFLDEARGLPSVRQAAASTSIPGLGFNWNGAAARRASVDPSNAIRGVVTYIDKDFAALYGLHLVAGRGFGDITIPTAKEAPWPLLVNETGARALGFKTAADAVGEAIVIGDQPGRVVGVLKDFHWSSAHEVRQNIFFAHFAAGSQISLRVENRDLPGTIAALRSLYDRFFPGNVFRYAFADDVFDRQYKDDRRFARLFTIFAGLAITIACLGLFGLAALSTRQRVKEIGVRKVLGASVAGLVGRLSLDFIKLVALGWVLGAPVAYAMMQGWLRKFAYRVAVGPGVFLLVAAISLAAAVLTVAAQCVRAASADPVKSLRYE